MTLPKDVLIHISVKITVSQLQATKNSHVGLGKN